MFTDISIINQKIGSAHYKIANSYYTGNGAKQDFKLALKHYMFAADNGNIPSQNNLGAMYLSGEGTIPSITNAQKYFQIAADNGSTQSQFNLARLYLDEHSTIYSKKQALKYLHLASKNKYIPALTLLASIYQYGNSAVRPDLDKAISLYKTAASKSSSHAQNELGVIYSSILSPSQPNKAIKYFSMASIAGFSEAKYNLATMFHNGEGVQIKLKKAFNLYSEAANAGHVNAMYNLAIMYKDASGVQEDIDLSIHWLKRCALVDDVGAMYNLGVIYRYGFSSIKPNLSLSRHWFTKASKLFCGPAISELNSLNSELEKKSNLIFVDF